MGEVKAGIDDNVSGYAWSENIGWISLNSTTVIQTTTELLIMGIIRNAR